MMKQHSIFKKIIFVLCIFITIGMQAHGSLTKRIKQKTVEISKQPKNAKLYFERGHLYEQHEEFNKAIKDYLKSEKLGYSELVLNYRKAQTYYSKNDFTKALEASTLYLTKDKEDVKINKLHAQILVKLGKYDEALKYYNFFVENAVDTNPNDIIEYSQIYLTKNSKEYSKPLQIIDFGLQKLGNNISSLQLKKLEYLEASLQTGLAIEQYNYFILNTDRKEFWYYKKAKYLSENNQKEDAKIAIQQTKAAISLLSDKFKSTAAVKTLQNDIDTLEKTLN